MNHRLSYVDAAKGFGILLVVMGHAAVPEPLKDWIYFFHMPFFFLLSGYVERPRGGPFGIELKRKAGRLLYPYFILGGGITVYLTILDLVRTGGMDWEKLAKRLSALAYSNAIWENNYDYIGTLWFLTALFSVEVLYSLLRRIVSGYRLAVLTALTSAGGFLMGAALHRTGFRLPFCLDAALPSLLFYGAGAALREREGRRPLCLPAAGPLLIAGGTAAGLLNTAAVRRTGACSFQVNVLGMEYGGRLLFVLSAVSLSTGFLLLLKTLYHRINLPILENIGRRSLLIMTLHIYIMAVVRAGLRLFGIDNGWAVILLTLALSYRFARMLERYLPWVYIKSEGGLRAGRRR